MSLEQVLEPFHFQVQKNSRMSRILSYAFARIKITINYRANFIMALVLNILTVFLYFFFAKLNPDMSIYGFRLSYLHFLAIGLSLQMIVGTALATTESSLASEILTGTFSAIFPHFNIIEYAIGVSLAGILLSSISVFTSLALLLILGHIFFHIAFLEIVLMIILFFLILFSNISISLFVAAFVIWYKKSSGFTKIIYQLYKSFSGIAFPIALLSGFPLYIARSLPLTYGLEALHNILLAEAIDYHLVVTNGLIMLIFTLLLGAMGLVTVKLAIHSNKKKNAIWWY